MKGNCNGAGEYSDDDDEYSERNGVMRINE